MLVPKPTQLVAADFLAAYDRALLADLPRCGKTGSAIIAADYILARKILVITTASGRGVWRAGFRDWSNFGRRVGENPARDDVVIVSWGGMIQPATRAKLLAQSWDLLIPDEAHAAKNFATKRTQSLYGTLSGDELATGAALASKAAVVWPLTGTPIPNCPLDVYPMMRALCPERLAVDAARSWPDVTALADFTKRFAKMRPMKVGKGWGARWVDVFVEGLNLDELRARLDGFYLQRTQQDVGILEPEYEIMPLVGAVPPELLSVDARRVMVAAEAGDTRGLEMHLGPLRRLTGEIKARLVAAAIREELDCGLDRVVLAFWHRDVGDALAEALHRVGVVRIDGSTSAKERTAATEAFRRPNGPRVFLAQIQAAGEAIDLSSAKHLVFVESSFVPKDMLQMSLRVTNHTQTQRPLVRVATLEGSVDDGLQKVLMRKWTAIKGVFG